MKIAFLDRDGTIIKDYKDDEWRYKTEPEFLKGSYKALKQFIAKGFQIIIVTNQYLIGEKIITIDQYIDFNNKFLKSLENNGIEILDLFYCPHSRKEQCDCMKPKPGLIYQSLVKYKKIKLEKSFIVGDSECDIKLGNSLKLKTFGIKIINNSLFYTKVNHLLEVVDYL